MRLAALRRKRRCCAGVEPDNSFENVSCGTGIPRHVAVGVSRGTIFIHKNAHERVTNKSAPTFYLTPFVADPFPQCPVFEVRDES